MTAEIDREIRASDKIEQIKVSEVILNAIEIIAALENDSPCKSLDSYKATLSSEIQPIVNGTMICGDDKTSARENCGAGSHDVYLATVTDQVEHVSIKESVPDEIATNDMNGVAVTLERAGDMTKTVAVCNAVQPLETVSDHEVNEDTKNADEIVSILGPSNIPLDVTHNVATIAAAGEDSEVPMNLIPPELTDILPVEIDFEATLVSLDNAESIAQLAVPALDLTVTPGAEDDAGIFSKKVGEMLTIAPAAGPAALKLLGKEMLNVTTVAIDNEPIDVEIPVNDAQTMNSIVMEDDDNLPVNEADITDTANIVTASYVENMVEIGCVAANEEIVDTSSAEIALEIPTAVTLDAVFTTVNSELLRDAAPKVLSAAQIDLDEESQIGVRATEASQIENSSTPGSLLDIDQAHSNLAACSQVTLLSAGYDLDNSEVLSETTTRINDVEKENVNEVVLSTVNAPGTDVMEITPRDATLLEELLSTIENAPADTADSTERSLKGESDDNLKIESSEIATISESIATESIEQLHVIPLNDITSSDTICPSIEPVQYCAIVLSTIEGDDSENIDLVLNRDGDVGMDIAEQKASYKSVLEDTVDQSALKGECVTSSPKDQSTSCPCSSESRDCESIQNDDLLKVDTFAKRLDYLNSVDKLNSPKRIHDDDVLDGEAVNEIVVIKESVVVTENIFIQENVFIKESIVIKECITMETTKAMYRPASLVRSDKTTSPLSEKILDNFALNDHTVLTEGNAAIIEGPSAFQSPILIDDVEITEFKEARNELDDGENRIVDDNTEEEVLETDKFVKSKVSLFTRLFGKKEVPPVEKTFVPICCSGVLSGSTCYGASADEKVAVKCDKNADKATVDMITTEDSDEGFLDT